MEGAKIDILSVLNYPLSLEIFWKEWFTAYPGREVFDRSIEDRIFIDNSTKFLNHVSQCKKRRQPCWLSVQPFQCRNRIYSLEKLFFDFDSKTDIRKAWVETKHFAASLERFYNVRTLVCFSGRKGYHVYVWFKEPFIVPDGNKEKAKHVYREMQNKILKGLKYETLDRQVIGDVKRVSRVPYTLHETSKLLCTPITLEHHPAIIHTLQPFRENGLDDGLLNLVLREKKKQVRRFIEKNENIRPCIEAAAKKLLEGNGGHLMRLAIATEYLNKGYSTPKIVELFRLQTDFNEEKTRYYIEDALRKRYKPFKCGTIRNLGFCLSTSCPIHNKSSDFSSSIEKPRGETPSRSVCLSLPR